jgi:hypothetical protein
MQGMASQAGDKRVSYLLTGLSVVLITAMAIKELKGLFRDEYADWVKNHERHQGKQWENHKQRHEQTHADRAWQAQGHERER